jgi:hypothetical protein
VTGGANIASEARIGEPVMAQFGWTGDKADADNFLYGAARMRWVREKKGRDEGRCATRQPWPSR